MNPGRCAGCGATNTSCKKIRTHVISCPEYLNLFKTEPEKCLDPAQEYMRWKRDDDTEENRQAVKDAYLRTKFAENDARREKLNARFAGTTDILAD